MTSHRQLDNTPTAKSAAAFFRDPFSGKIFILRRGFLELMNKQKGWWHSDKNPTLCIDHWGNLLEIR